MITVKVKGEVNKMNDMITITNNLAVQVLTQDVVTKYTNTLTSETLKGYMSTYRNFFGTQDLANVSVALIQSITPDIANAWAKQKVEDGLSEQTVNKKLSSLQSLYKFFCRRNIGIMSYNPFDTDEGCIRFKNAGHSYSTRIALTPEQISDIVGGIQTENFDTENDELIAKRDYLVLAILISAGLRQAELRSIKIGDIQFVEGKHLIEVTGKGNKKRLMVLADSIKDKIDDYVIMRGLDYDEDFDAPLIISHSRNSNPNAPVSDKTIERIIKKYAKLADVDPKLVSPHVMRHTFCTELLRMGTNIEDVADMMGHANTRTTRRYDHIVRTVENSRSEALVSRFNL